MGNRVICGDCLQVLPTLADNSVNLIATDPPYFGVKSDDWDNQWKTKADFLSWLGLVLDQFQRVLKPNGSLYLFMSPAMSYDVEGLIRERFNLLANIRWVKDAGWHQKNAKEELRTYLQPWESVFFAEHRGSDNIAKGEAGYAAKCDELRGFIFEPLRAYLDGERKRAGVTTQELQTAWMVYSESRGVFKCLNVSEWRMVTRRTYSFLSNLFGGMSRSYEELRQQYEDLRREYEDLRRPFNGSAARPYTDVWDFATVASYPGKHPCEKPADLCAHIIETSSRPGDVVLDSFAGSGVMLQAARLLGRQFIGIEGVRYWADKAATRAQAQRDIAADWQPVNARRKQRAIVQTDLFGDAAA